MLKGIIKTLFSFSILCALGISVVGYYVYISFEKPGPSTIDTYITVQQGEHLTGIANAMEDQGLISEKWVFTVAARFHQKAHLVKAGDYLIPARASMSEILELLIGGKAATVKVTIPEGYTSWQIVERLNSFPSLNGTIEELPAEGSLLPETYIVSALADRNSIIELMRAAMDRALDEAWNNRDQNTPLKSKEELLILASIVEKETGVADERPQVASVFINRLNKKMRLQSDPTVIYGLTNGRESLGRGIRQSELREETPFNTYVIPGLPASPIANPGKESLKATANPDNTKYLFFVADGTGGHQFATTLKEHNKNVAYWRKVERERRLEQEKAKSSENN